MVTNTPKRKTTAKVKWLIKYVANLSNEYQKVLKDEREDFSQDKIKLIFHRDRFSNFLIGTEEKIIPITFEVWPSLSCNARCPLCTYSLNDARVIADKSDELFLADLENYKLIFEDFASVGVRSLVFTGGGEPTLHPHITEMTSYSNKIKLEWGMFTHGLNLNVKMIHELLDSNPRFVRISVNAGSARAHHLEYRISSNSYEKVKENVIMASRISMEYQKVIGLGYALNGKTSDAELEGIKKFVTEVMNKSKGGLRFVAFRPKVVYYYERGKPRRKQPAANNLSDLAERIQEKIIEPLAKRFGKSLRLDHKQAMFNRLVTIDSSIPAFGNGWTGQIDHRGNGYILSELNGSPWKNSCYGRFNGSNFSEIWNSNKRRDLSKQYIVGNLLPPVHHKLSHVDELLSVIRNGVGVLTPQEVEDFYNEFTHIELQKPKNWDFL